MRRFGKTLIRLQCHYVLHYLLFTVLCLNLCLLTKAEAEADASPDADAAANPDPLWDKLPSLQRFHAAGKKLALKPIQGFATPKSGNVMHI